MNTVLICSPDHMFNTKEEYLDCAYDYLAKLDERFPSEHTLYLDTDKVAASLLSDDKHAVPILTMTDSDKMSLLLNNIAVDQADLAGKRPIKLKSLTTPLEPKKMIGKSFDKIQKSYREHFKTRQENLLLDAMETAGLAILLDFGQFPYKFPLKGQVCSFVHIRPTEHKAKFYVKGGEQDGFHVYEEW